MAVQPHTTPPRVLLVEDDPDLSMLLERVLKLGGYHCVVAGTLAAGRSLIDREAFDALMIDIVLPDGRGTDLLPLLASGPNHNTPVIISSGNTNLVPRGDPRIKCVLQKPYDFQTLLRSLESVG